MEDDQRKVLDCVQIIGGGFSGMLYAIAIAPFCRQVRLFESGALPDSNAPDYRKGTPQDQHQHTLLLRGRELLQQYVPDFEAQLDALTVPETDYINDCELFTHGGRLPRFPSSIKIRPCRRPVIDFILAKQLKLMTHIECYEHCRISNLLVEDNKVTGVIAKWGDKPAEKLRADLTIDCSGRNSKVMSWLSAESLNIPEVSQVTPHLGYASCLFKKPDNAPNWKGVEIACHAPKNPKAAGLWEVENQQWLLTLIGTAGEYPPNDYDGFMAFAKSLESSSVYDAIKDLQPLSTIRSHRGTDNQWRHFEKMKDMPEGLMVCADAHCCYNPYYGQGMTINAITADVFAKNFKLAAKKGLQGTQALKLIRQKYYRKSFLSLWLGWSLATFEDARWPSTEGLSLRWYEKLFFIYLDKVLHVAITNEKVTEICVKIANMTLGAQAILHPYIIVQSLFFSFKRTSPL